MKYTYFEIHMKNPTEFFQEWYALMLLLSQQKILKPIIFKGRHLADYQPL